MQLKNRPLLEDVITRTRGERFADWMLEGRLTFAKAREALIDELKKQGWQYTWFGKQGKLKVPYITSKGGRLRLWFKAQAVYYSQTTGGSRDPHSFKNARSLHIDIRDMAPKDVVAYLEKHYESVENDESAEWLLGESFPSVGSKMRFHWGSGQKGEFEVVRKYPSEEDAEGAIGRDLLRTIPLGGGGAIIKKLKGEMQAGHYFIPLSSAGKPDGYPIWMPSVKVKRAMSAAMGEMSQDVVTDDEGIEAVPTGRKTRQYRKGQVVSVLDDSGYHDAKVKVVDTMIYKDLDYAQYYILVSVDGERQFEKASKTGKMNEA